MVGKKELNYSLSAFVNLKPSPGATHRLLMSLKCVKPVQNDNHSGKTLMCFGLKLRGIREMDRDEDRPKNVYGQAVSREKFIEFSVPRDRFFVVVHPYLRTFFLCPPLPQIYFY